MLAGSFNRMRLSLVKAMKMLEEQYGARAYRLRETVSEASAPERRQQRGIDPRSAARARARWPGKRCGLISFHAAQDRARGVSSTGMIGSLIVSSTSFLSA